MKNILFFILLISLSLLIDCKHPKVQVEEIQIEENRFHHINVDSTYEQIDLKLSDLADSFRLVRLETSKESIINAWDYYVGDKYIIAASIHDGFYKFSSNGKFLTKMFSFGRGPDEMVGNAYTYYYDEKRDLLYLDDMDSKWNLLVYDLNLNKFSESIKKAIPGRFMEQIAVYNDSLIIGKSTAIAEPYVIMFQNFDGKFVSGIHNTKKILWGDDPKEHYQFNYLLFGQNTILTKFELDDTIFKLKDDKLIPYISLDFNKPRKYPPNAKVQKGDRKISIPISVPSGFLIITVSTLEEVTWFGYSTYRPKNSYKYFLFDEYTGKSSIIRTYEDNFTGNIQSSTGNETIKFPVFQKNGKLFVIYQPQMIKRIAERTENGQLNSILTPILKKEIIDINENLEETDNPILLIGKVKEKI